MNALKNSLLFIVLQVDEVDNVRVSSKHEIKELSDRVGELQQSKSTLEARVRILEESGASLAEELTRKTKIVEGFILQKRTSKPGKSQYI